jgi:hypothetical protein
LDLSHVPDKTVAEAWTMLKQASDEREIGEFKEVSAGYILSHTTFIDLFTP